MYHNAQKVTTNLTRFLQSIVAQTYTLKSPLYWNESGQTWQHRCKLKDQQHDLNLTGSLIPTLNTTATTEAQKPTHTHTHIKTISPLILSLIVVFNLDSTTANHCTIKPISVFLNSTLEKKSTCLIHGVCDAMWNIIPAEVKNWNVLFDLLRWKHNSVSNRPNMSKLAAADWRKPFVWKGKRLQTLKNKSSCL